MYHSMLNFILLSSSHSSAQFPVYIRICTLIYITAYPRAHKELCFSNCLRVQTVSCLTSLTADWCFLTSANITYNIILKFIFHNIVAVSLNCNCKVHKILLLLHCQNFLLYMNTVLCSQFYVSHCAQKSNVKLFQYNQNCDSISLIILW